MRDGQAFPRGVILLLGLAAAAALATAAAAEAPGPIESRLIFDPSGLERPSGHAPRHRPAPASVQPGPQDRTRNGNAPRLQLEYADEGAKPSRARAPSVASPPAELSLSLGGLSLETDTRLKANQFPSGEPIRGIHNPQRQAPTYFGLSWAVQTEAQPSLDPPALHRLD
jgi:hypothetical protein